jgi:putative DNA-invertase from lambdoid prophage Rac
VPRTRRRPDVAATARCYGYARVSTWKQANDGESLEVQERKIAGYATILGVEVERTFVERGVSGSRPLAERPEGRALLAALQPGDTVITPKLDRMFRSALDALAVLGELRKRGVSLHMIDLGGDVTGNGISKLLFTILSAVAEAERDRTRERISEVKADQRKRGRFLGGSVPFGWRRDGNGGLVPVPTEQDAIQRIHALRAQGLSLRAIAQQLADAGHHVSHVAVQHVLANAARNAAA